MPTLREILEKQFGDDKEGLNSALEQAGLESSALVDNTTKGLKQKRDDLLEANKKLKDNQLPDNFDMSEYDKLIEEKEKLIKDKEDAEHDKLVQTEAWDTLKDKLNQTNKQAFDTMVSEKDKALNQITRSYFEEKKTNDITKALEAEKANATLLTPHIMPNLDVVLNPESNKYETIVVDALGKQRTVDETGDVMTITNLVNDFKANEAFAIAFPEANKGSGQGANLPAGHAGASNPFKKGDTWNLTEQAKMRKTNPDLAKAMQKAAG